MSDEPDTADLMFAVVGTPRSQPRPRFVRGRVVSTASPAAKLWRAAVGREVDRMMAARGFPVWLSGPVEVRMDFQFAAPRARWGQPHTAKPDADNLAKPIMDELERRGALRRGDQRVARLVVRKVYGERPGVVVRVAPLAGAEGDGGPGALPDWLRSETAAEPVERRSRSRGLP